MEFYRLCIGLGKLKIRIRPNKQGWIVLVQKDNMIIQLLNYVFGYLFSGMAGLLSIAVETHAANSEVD
jgi:hypothetical protein